MTLPTVSRLSTQGQYAFATARAIIHDGGVADLVDLYFDQGFWRRAHIAPQWLRLGTKLSGLWTVTFYFRTGVDGRFKELPYVTTIRTVAASDPVFRWEAAGRLTQLDPQTYRATFRIRPDRPGLKPFLLHANSSKELMSKLIRGELLHISGTLENELLIIKTAELA